MTDFIPTAGVAASRPLTERAGAAGHRPPSQGDVAALAGVSTQTVSRVVNNRTNVDGETRERVLSAMRMLGYRANTAARALATGQFHTLGVISFDLSAYGNARTLQAISQAAQDADYSVNVTCARSQTEGAVRQAFSKLTSQAVDGIILIEAQILDRPGLQLPHGVPVVVVDGDPDRRFHTVDSNQTDGARAATEHLLKLGHRTVWHLAGPQDAFSARRRAAAWHGALKAAGAPVPAVLYGDWSAQSGYEAGRKIAAREDVTAVFAGNDHMALGLIRALSEAGRRVPDDVSVVGYDDVAEAEFFLPPLTTVRQNFDEVGRRCVSLLLDQIHSGREAAGGVHSVPPKLVVRTSTAPRRG
ncbi:LacI family DNA-binding transcriptional regulator [Streptomyces sp. NPDC058405]|uniref:LacI family DNA-binding transcriptional regulator n=1 Tax=unclassified Streptomyces TaxID=2593676 RepID=UPI00366755BA